MGPTQPTDQPTQPTNQPTTPSTKACYGIAEVPEGEWLCWPCSVHEASLRARGVPQDQVRPPRWAMPTAGQAPALEGGANSVECALCPVRCGVFKRCRDDGRWVHMVCAHHHPEVVVEQGEWAGGGGRLGLAWSAV